MKWLGLAIAVGVLGGFIYAGEIWVPKKIEQYSAPEVSVQTIDKSDEMFAAKIDVLKDQVIEELAKCESGGRREEDGIVILDSNDKGSYGPLQFQRKTVMHYYKMMTGNEINGRDAIILALQGDKARELAKYVVFSTNSGVAKDWVNCSKWHGLQSKVDMIKSMEK